MQVGAMTKAAGYITQAKYLRSQSAAELDRRLGFRAGRMAKGWTLLFLVERLTPEDFEFRGYTQMSGGVAQGHLNSPPDPRNAEQRLSDDGFDIRRMKEKIIRDTFKYVGPDRLCKVLPHADPFGEADYPPGSGIPQWQILRSRQKQFKIAAIIDPGATYLGDYT